MPEEKTVITTGRAVQVLKDAGFTVLVRTSDRYYVEKYGLDALLSPYKVCRLAETVKAEKAARERGGK